MRPAGPSDGSQCVGQRSFARRARCPAPARPRAAATTSGADAGMGVMSDGPDPVDTGLFGKLPRSRPGTRSPRRASTGVATQKAEPAKAEAKAAREPRAPVREPPTPVREHRPPDRESPAGDAEERGAGLEELAWAGIAVTAEAATLGVRLMSRALDAARRATERG